MALVRFGSANAAGDELRRTFRRQLTPIAVENILYDLGVAQIRIGDAYRKSGNPAPSADAYTTARRYFARLRLHHPGNKNFERMEAVTSARLGLIRRQEADFSKSYQEFENAVLTYERLLDADAKNSGWKRDLQITLGNLGESLLAGGDVTRAKEVFLRSAVLASEIVRLDETKKVWRNDLAIANIQVGVAELRLGNSNEARNRLRNAKRQLVQAIVGLREKTFDHRTRDQEQIQLCVMSAQRMG